MNTFYVYALQSLRDGYLYIGMTRDVLHRLDLHNAGRVKSTKSRRPFRVFYQELCKDRAAARSREIYLKSGIGREFLKNFL